MTRNLLLVLIAAGALLATACTYVSVSPESDTNPVGTTHTVSATLSLDIPDVCGLFPDFPGCEEGPPIGTTTIGENISFEVVEGPNEGAHSDGDCGPTQDQLCIVTVPGDSVTWTYLGDGGPGIDYIQVCSLIDLDLIHAALVQETGLSAEEITAMFAASVRSVENDQSLEINEPEPEPGCDIVSKVWVAPTPEPTATAEPRERVERSVPNIGAGLSGLFNGQPTALPTAPSAVAPAATTPVIRPPSTGDAGLQ